MWACVRVVCSVNAIALQCVDSRFAGLYAEKEREVEEDADVENNAALLNSKSHETKGKEGHDFTCWSHDCSCGWHLWR